jgi:hypothetical protein
MSSISKSKARGRIAMRRDGMAQREDQRIVVQHDGEITSILYRGQDPNTRYLPRERSVWGQIREAFRMG